jgi:hypothetical protein
MKDTPHYSLAQLDAAIARAKSCLPQAVMPFARKAVEQQIAELTKLRAEHPSANKKKPLRGQAIYGPVRRSKP